MARPCHRRVTAVSPPFCCLCGARSGVSFSAVLAIATSLGGHNDDDNDDDSGGGDAHGDEGDDMT